MRRLFEHACGDVAPILFAQPAPNGSVERSRGSKALDILIGRDSTAEVAMILERR